MTWAGCGVSSGCPGSESTCPLAGVVGAEGERARDFVIVEADRWLTRVSRADHLCWWIRICTSEFARDREVSGAESVAETPPLRVTPR